MKERSLLNFGGILLTLVFLLNVTIIVLLFIELNFLKTTIGGIVSLTSTSSILLVAVGAAYYVIGRYEFRKRFGLTFIDLEYNYREIKTKTINLRDYIYENLSTIVLSRSNLGFIIHILALLETDIFPFFLRSNSLIHSRLRVFVMRIMVEPFLNRVHKYINDSKEDQDAEEVEMANFLKRVENNLEIVKVFLSEDSFIGAFALAQELEKKWNEQIKEKVKEEKPLEVEGGGKHLGL